MKVNLKNNEYKNKNFTSLPSKYKQVDRFLIRGPHPAIKDLISLKEEGVNQIYDFRHKGYRGFKFIEKFACKILGINYIRKAYSYLDDKFPTIEEFEEVANSVSENGKQGGKTLFHCNSGSHRTAHMTAFYRLIKGKETLEEAKEKHGENFVNETLNTIISEICNKNYYNRELIEYKGINPVKHIKAIFNNRRVLAVQRGQESFIDRILPEDQTNELINLFKEFYKNECKSHLGEQTSVMQAPQSYKNHPRYNSNLDNGFYSLYNNLMNPRHLTIEEILDQHDIGINDIDSEGNSLLMKIINMDCYSLHPLDEASDKYKLTKKLFKNSDIDVTYTKQNGEDALSTLLNRIKKSHEFHCLHNPAHRSVELYIKKLGINYCNPVTNKTVYDVLKDYNYEYTEFILEDKDFDINKNSPIFHLIKDPSSIKLKTLLNWLQNPSFDRNVINENGETLDYVLTTPYNSGNGASSEAKTVYEMVRLKERCKSDFVIKNFDKKHLADFFVSLKIDDNDNKSKIAAKKLLYELYELEDLKYLMEKAQKADNNILKDLIKIVSENKSQEPKDFPQPLYGPFSGKVSLTDF